MLAHLEYKADQSFTKFCISPWDYTRNYSIRIEIFQAKQQMEERLDRFIVDNGIVSGGRSSYHLSSSSGAQYLMEDESSSLESSLDVSDPELIRILADGSARFLHHQIMELAGDCLQKSREDFLTSVYFYDMSQNLDDLLNQVTNRTGPTINIKSSTVCKYKPFSNVSPTRI